MDGGSIVANGLSTDNGNETVDGETSYYRVAEFDVSSLLNPDGSLAVDAHITMSCGNDVMTGNFEIPGSPPPPAAAGVPEPSTIALLGVGLAGLAGGAARRRMKKKKEEAK
ncbi:MAG: PEP-CTERM sorting domain-containing protein [Candidatus Brocadiaceae bacterium]|nr:PEP-CTERM sorting domain-containing protein [Candidatus Brocadiaceae bacterium]